MCTLECQKEEPSVVWEQLWQKAWQTALEAGGVSVQTNVDFSCVR